MRRREARWFHAVSGPAGELLASAYHRQHRLRIVTVHPFNIDGPGQAGKCSRLVFLRKASSASASPSKAKARSLALGAASTKCCMGCGSPRRARRRLARRSTSASPGRSPPSRVWRRPSAACWNPIPASSASPPLLSGRGVAHTRYQEIGGAAGILGSGRTWRRASAGRRNGTGGMHCSDAYTHWVTTCHLPGAVSLQR